MKDIKILVSSLLIIISFFIWYYFSENKNEFQTSKNLEKQNYVNLEILKTKIKITKDKETKISINWKLTEKNIIDLK